VSKAAYGIVYYGAVVLAGVWVVLPLCALYAVATANDSMFRFVAWVAIALGLTVAALQFRR
jgi:hypothetical protein